MTENDILEIVIPVVITAIAALYLPKGRLRFGFIFLGMSCTIGLSMYQRPSLAVQLSSFRPDDATTNKNPEYASSRACKSCHPSQYKTWFKSYHRTMTQPASKAAILAPFDGRVLKEGHRSYRVFQHDGGFYVDMPAFGTLGTTQADRIIQPVVMTTGSHHMQAYWIPVPWFGERTSVESRAAFNGLCGSCHGADGLGGAVISIVDADLDREHVRSALATTDHLTLERDNPKYQLAVQYALANQYTGRLAQFPFVYLVKAKRWAHEDHTFMQPPETDQHREPYGDRWSKGCDQCHSVKPSFAWKPGEERHGDAAVAELGIACEACHGPGQKHIMLHQNPVTRYSRHLGWKAEDDIVNPGTMDHKTGSHVCAQCHAELVIKDGVKDFKPGQPMSAFAHVLEYLPDAPPQWLANAMHGEPNLLSDAFWRDGTMRIAGRDFNGLVKTGCFTEGTMSCMTCHTMHGDDPNDQLKAKARGNAVCAECHPKETEAGSAHTHHGPDSSGSLCYNCHMPHTTVGLLGLIRAHRVDSPSAAQSAWTGRPNACSLCHLDQTLEQTAKHLSEWYGQKPLPKSTTDLGSAASVAWLLRGDAVQRAAAAWHMGWAPAQEASGTDWQARYLIELLDDPYSAVRYIAGKALNSLPGFRDFNYDYTLGEESYSNARERALQIWSKRPPPKDNPALWFTTGKVDEEKISVLKSRRDNSPVRVNE